MKAFSLILFFLILGIALSGGCAYNQRFKMNVRPADYDSLDFTFETLPPREHIIRPNFPENRLDNQNLDGIMQTQQAKEK